MLLAKASIIRSGGLLWVPWLWWNGLCVEDCSIVDALPNTKGV